MNEVTQVRLANWASFIQQRNESGLSIKQWCADKNISEKYYYWLKRLRKAAPETLPAEKSAIQSQEADGVQLGTFIVSGESWQCSMGRAK